KLDILEREKEKAIKIYVNHPNGLWWSEFRLDRNRREKTGVSLQRDPERG
ncbi:hypothetical protein AVEN_214900-1, partial [Araneus ventricosus]